MRPGARTAGVAERAPRADALVARLRTIALEALGPMYRPARGRFVFRLRRDGRNLAAEGLSARYTAITLMGLAREAGQTSAAILGGASPAEVCERLVGEADTLDTLGDIALTCWAASELECPARRTAVGLLRAAAPESRVCSIVELAWSLSALCVQRDAGVADLRQRVAARLLRQFRPESGTFPHQTGARSSLRAHVACFADQVYPILALSQYVALTGDPWALRVASETARHLVRLQGAAGQWWWHYDTRRPVVVEEYPVYAVHQDGMAPMALGALARVAGSAEYDEPIARGLQWLVRTPEIGGTLVDDGRRIIWRKVGRRDPLKAARYLQAIASRVRPGARWPLVDRLFPPVAIDFECRPYHLGWLLYAWPPDAPWIGEVAQSGRGGA
ncbi:MAG: hypothetical protein IT176_03165 [Acidobacteria bacterium]|nr:hypothetical protein [Acidobacteriota bacterium]